MRSVILCAAVLAAAFPWSARACGGEGPVDTVEVLGFADGGRLFVWRVTTEGADLEDGDGSSTLVKLHALDLRSSDEKVLTYEPYEGEDEDAPKPYARAMAWLEKHPPRPAKVSRASREGKARLEVEVLTHKPEDQGHWSGGEWSGEAALFSVLRISRDGKSTISAVADSATAAGYWTPDGKRVVWELDQGAFVVGPAQGPRVQVVANRDAVQALLIPALDALEAKGFVPVRAGRAQDRRQKSVVYYAAGFEQTARDAAAAVPGGATVEKQDWNSSYELVVALGESARHTR